MSAVDGSANGTNVVVSISVPSGAVVVLGSVATSLATTSGVHLSFSAATRAPSTKKWTPSMKTNCPAEPGSPGAVLDAIRSYAAIKIAIRTTLMLDTSMAAKPNRGVFFYEPCFEGVPLSSPSFRHHYGRVF